MTPEKKRVLIYWEVSRVVFLLLAVIAFRFTWGISNSFNAGIDDLPVARYSDAGVWRTLLSAFVVVNALFSMGYVGEFFLSGWRFWKVSRPMLTVALVFVGCFYSMREASRSAELISLQKAIWSGENKTPNQSSEPTPTSGTSAAEQPLVPAAVVAHL